MPQPFEIRIPPLTYLNCERSNRITCLFPMSTLCFIISLPNASCDAWLTSPQDLLVSRTCGVTVKWIRVEQHQKILQLNLDWDHVHCLTQGIMSTWNFRRCTPACKVVHMVSVENQLEYLPVVFQVQFDTRQRSITRASSSDDASPRCHKQ